MWTTEWRALSARIGARIDAATFATRTRQYEGSGVSAILAQGAYDIEIRLKSLFEVYKNEIPDEPKIFLWNYLQDEIDEFVTPVISVTAITRLAVFKAEFEYLGRRLHRLGGMQRNHSQGSS